MYDLSQIQIVPVENGFFIQVINADGSGSLNPRRVAHSREQLVAEIKTIADGLYTKEPPNPQQMGGVTEPSRLAPPDASPAAGTAPKV